MTASNLISITILLPFVGALLVALLPRSEKGLLKAFALGVTALPLISSAILYARFDASIAGFQFVEQMPWALSSGESFKVTVPGDMVIVYEIDPGKPLATKALEPKPLPAAKATVTDKTIALKLQVPDEAMKRYELIIQPWGTINAELTVDGKSVPARQSSKDARWSIHAFDLLAYRGKTITLQVSLKADPAADKKPAASVLTEAWIFADRPVTARAAPTDQHLPKPIFQNFRRITQNVLAKQKVPVTK